MFPLAGVVRSLTHHGADAGDLDGAAGGKKVFVTIITVVNTAFWILLLKTGMEKVITQMANGKHTFSLGWPEWVFTIFLPIGCIFLILHTIEYLVDVLHGDADCVKEEGGND